MARADDLCGCLPAVAACLSAKGVGRLRAAGREVGRETEPLAAALVREAIAATGACPATLAHYVGILGKGAERHSVLLLRRRWLLQIDEETKFSQWRTDSAVARLMIGVSMDACDLFATLKRAFLASQVPALESSNAIARWMHVLGAVEEQDLVQARLLGREAWGALAPLVTEDNLIWVVQTAHFVDGLPELPGWLLVDGGPRAAQLLGWLRELEARLRREPQLGRYGPAGDISQVRARHVAQIVPRVTVEEQPV